MTHRAGLLFALVLTSARRCDRSPRARVPHAIGRRELNFPRGNLDSTRSLRIDDSLKVGC